MFFQFDCKQTRKSASDGDWRHSLDVDTKNSITHAYGSSHTLNKHKCLMFWVTFLVRWNGAYYKKNVVIVFKILISNVDGLVFVHHDSQKIKDIQIYWDSGNKVLDTYSLIQSLACAMLT